MCTASVEKLKPVLFSLIVPGNVPGLERAYEALGITLARNGEPRLQQPYPGKKSFADFLVLKSLVYNAMLNKIRNITLDRLVKNHSTFLCNDIIIMKMCAMI